MNADSMQPNVGATAAKAAGVGRSKWRYLKDMKLPPELQKVVEDTCKEWKCRKPAARLDVEEDIKLQHFFGGQAVAYVTTPQGLLIVATGELGTEDFSAQLALLSREERRQVTIYSPSIWNESTTSR